MTVNLKQLLDDQADESEPVGPNDQSKEEAGTTAVGKISTEHEEVYIDPQLLAQATQNKNARLIAMMVHENAMFEVALEQERRARQDAEAKYQALLASLQD